MTRKILDTKSVTCVSSHYFVVTREKKNQFCSVNKSSLQVGSRSSYTCLDAVYLFLSSFPLSLETNVDTGSFCEFSGLMLVYQIRFRLNCALFVILLCHSILHVSICAFPDVGTTKPKIAKANKEKEGCEIEREYAVQLCHIYGWFNVNWLFVL